MPKCLKNWKGPKAEAYRKRNADNYYKDPTIDKFNHHQRYTIHEINEILFSGKPDKQLARELGRSPKAIEEARARFKNRSVKNETD